ncbi:ATP-grasp domain-containing protein [Caulobacter sp. ErkDOM-E]|uniref:ATP-grasp domain-containing protein n=1 Tax=Caulobacter sp. ErkDOM-E TaxID=3402778 RepID=UPI003AF9E3E2
MNTVEHRHFETSLGTGLPMVGVLTGSDGVRQMVTDTRERTEGTGNNDCIRMIKMLDPPVDIGRMHITPGYFRGSRRYALERCDLLWNAITDMDQNAETLEVARKMLTGVKKPVINPPELIPRTRRHEIPKVLANLDGVKAPKALRFKYPTLERLKRLVADHDFKFPAIVRPVGTHSGQVVGLFNAVEDLEVIFGDRKTEYYMTEFVDVRRPDGYYHKTRLYFVGDEILIRQHIISDEWSIHGRSGRGVLATNENLQAECRAMLVNGFEALPAPTRAALHSIRQRVGLDYCGLDCAVVEDGSIVVFECNATMNFKPNFLNPATQHNRAALPRMLSALRRLIHAKTGLGPAGEGPSTSEADAQTVRA